MLVDFAPYLFRGKLCGFLTRLSATGLANVTSGGGQVPAFPGALHAELSAACQKMQKVGRERLRNFRNLTCKII